LGSVSRNFGREWLCRLSINPKQLDRFRDRFTVAGAKDDGRDAFVLAGSLRTDRRSYQRVEVDALRAAGHQHARALRGLSDRLLQILPSILKHQTVFTQRRQGTMDATRLLSKRGCCTVRKLMQCPAV
jgi:hypothetical protein